MSPEYKLQKCFMFKQLPLTVEQHGFGLHGFIYVWVFSFPITTQSHLFFLPGLLQNLLTVLLCHCSASVSTEPSEHAPQFMSLVCTKPPSGLHFTQNKIQGSASSSQPATSLTFQPHLLSSPHSLLIHLHLFSAWNASS